MATYEEVRSFITLCDETIAYLNTAVQQEQRDKEQLCKEIEKTKKEIEEIRQAISVLDGPCDRTLSLDMVQEAIDRFGSTLTGADSVSDYIAHASDLVTLHHATAKEQHEWIKKAQSHDSKQIQRVKKHPKYKTWVSNADRLKYTIRNHAMPDDLSEYTDRALNLIIGYGARVLWEPYKRYMCYHLFTVYKQTLQRYNERKKQIRLLDSFHGELKQLIHRWTERLQAELKDREAALERWEHQYASFEADAARRMQKRAAECEHSIITMYPPDAWNRYFSDITRRELRWDKVKKKEDLRTKPQECFSLSNSFRSGTQRINDNPYAESLGKRIAALYPSSVSVLTGGSALLFRHPVLMHLDTLRYRFCVDISGLSAARRNNINGVAQRMAASVVTHLPVGKVKLIFGDPANTGVFTNFKNVGRNGSEGSALCTYIADETHIQRELERLSDQIGYTISNILQGTKTTLYQHNSRHSFNSSPYEFLFLMDYPQNMTAKSLQTLKNIVVNGPQCGIFTFIFYSGGTAMQQLRPEEQLMAREIAEFDFIVKDGIPTDRHGFFLEGGGEVDTVKFNRFIAHYNEALRNRGIHEVLERLNVRDAFDSLDTDAPAVREAVNDLWESAAGDSTDRAETGEICGSMDEETLPANAKAVEVYDGAWTVPLSLTDWTKWISADDTDRKE